MAVPLGEDVVRALNAPEARKALSTISRDGKPHTVFKDSIRADESGKLLYYEYIETSRTHKNMVSSIWFGVPVSVAVILPDGRSYQIVGKPVKAIISGPEFEKVYVSVRRSFGGDYDLSTIWVIEPEEVREETLDTRVHEQTARYPHVGHVDRFLKSGFAKGPA
jgi:hypothetical protein